MKHQAVTAALALVSIVAIGCAAPPLLGGNECRSQSDCNDNTSCASANDDGPRCGFGPPSPECSGDAECAESEFCVVVDADSCNAHLACVPACVDATSCRPDEVCGGDGRCAPRHCDDGFPCAAWRTCGGANDDADLVDEHGCVTHSCATDLDCTTNGTGINCVNGLCASGLGTCEPPVP